MMIIVQMIRMIMKHQMIYIMEQWELPTEETEETEALDQILHEAANSDPPPNQAEMRKIPAKLQCLILR